MRRVSDLYKYSNVPISVLVDVNKRIMDWIASGGKEKDSYIQRQIEYVEQVHEKMQNRGVLNERDII